jgi:hypothetical protein
MSLMLPPPQRPATNRLSTSVRSRERSLHRSSGCRPSPRKAEQPAEENSIGKDNVLRFVDRLDRFVPMPGSMGSNCDVDAATVSRLVKSVTAVSATRSRDWSEITAVRLGP